jgi:hypothetical protein
VSAQKIIYLAGFRQHAGKTVTSIGLFSLLRKHFAPRELGYVKPVGQELTPLPDGTKVDKDVVVIDTFCGIPDLDLDSVSPVRLGSGFTKRFLRSPDRAGETAQLTAAIRKTFARLQDRKVIIVEGTGHPGVGGIVGLSNAVVSNLVGAEVIYLSGGGIGRALDMLEVDLSYFLHRGSRVKGLIFNKVFPDKLDQVKEFITEDLVNSLYPFPEPLRIFGYLPEIEMLARPSMSLILAQFQDARALGDPEDPLWKRPCHNIRIISQTSEYLKPEQFLDPGDVVLLGAASHSRKTRLLSYNRTLRRVGSTLGGVVLTCGKTTPLDPEIEREIVAAGVPAVYVQEDTATAEQRIQTCFENTKLQVYDADKVRHVEELFSRHFDVEKFLHTFRIP